MKFITLAAIALMAAPCLVAKDSEIVKFLNEHLGMDRHQLLLDYGTPSKYQASEDSIGWEFEDNTFLPGKAASSTTVSRGQVDRDGAWQGRSITTVELGSNSELIHLISRFVYFFDANATAIKWEEWQAVDPRFSKCEYCTPEQLMRRPTHWIVVDARQVEVGKSGKASIKKPKQRYPFSTTLR